MIYTICGSFGYTATPILPILAPDGNPDPGVESNCHVVPPSILLYTPLDFPPSSKFHALRVRYQAVAYSSSVFCKLISMSTAPVLSSIASVCFQDLPPSVVL